MKLMTSTKLTEILDDGVMAETSEGFIKIPCDNVVFAVGFR